MTESFEVHLKSLLDFAAELEGQMTALGLPNDRLAVLTGAPMPLGDFTEARTLGERHRRAAAELAALLGAAQQALLFAANATRAVAAGYEAQDEQAAADIRRGTVYTSGTQL